MLQTKGNVTLRVTAPTLYSLQPNKSFQHWLACSVQAGDINGLTVRAVAATSDAYIKKIGRSHNRLELPMKIAQRSVLLGASLIVATCACLAQAQERRTPKPGFMSHSISLHPPNEDCEQATIQFAIANGTVQVNFTDIRKDAPFKLSGGGDQSKMTYILGGPNCKVELTLSKQ